MSSYMSSLLVGISYTDGGGSIVPASGSSYGPEPLEFEATALLLKEYINVKD